MTSITPEHHGLDDPALLLPARRHQKLDQIDINHGGVTGGRDREFRQFTIESGQSSADSFDQSRGGISIQRRLMGFFRSSDAPGGRGGRIG